jgi:hypothetical protein
MVIGTLGFLGSVVQYFLTQVFDPTFAGVMVTAGFGGAVTEGVRQLTQAPPPPQPPGTPVSEES